MQHQSWIEDKDNSSIYQFKQGDCREEENLVFWFGAQIYFNT